MRFNSIFNYPEERMRVTYPFVWEDDAFTPQELTDIGTYCANLGTEVATTIGGNTNDVRRSVIRFHRYWESPELRTTFERLNNVIRIINERWYGFELNGYESFQYTEYYAEVGGKYDWHMDLCLGRDCLPANMLEPRKLSISLMLNEPEVDFEGGQFQFNTGLEANARTAECKRGRILAFPSWMIHRVTPVTRGVRKSLVVWVTGPKFS